MDYIEIAFRIEPFCSEYAEIVEAIVCDCGFESFVTESTPDTLVSEDAPVPNEAPALQACGFLKGYIPVESYSAEVVRHLKILLSDYLSGSGSASCDESAVCSEKGSASWDESAAGPDSGEMRRNDGAGEVSHGFKVSFSTNYIKEQNWNLPWEEQFSPIVVDGLCTVKADFHKGLKRTRFNITIRPNMAFGTGHHQTTTLMMRTLLRLAGAEPWPADVTVVERAVEMMRHKESGADGAESSIANETESSVQSENMLKGMQVLDMGTGTGILAILAAKLGALRPVHAIDIDATAVNSAKENLWKNRLHRAVVALYGDASLIQANKYNIILANINRNILLEDISTYARGLKPGGLLVMSGFYKKDIPMLVDGGRPLGLLPLFSEVFIDQQAAGVQQRAEVQRCSAAGASAAAVEQAATVQPCAAAAKEDDELWALLILQKKICK